ncbi:hypothetical protein [Burkholderia gladioli]|uniref:hypothetical protein n=1 Tax=Burkholderia gladioli TaxID=28095 RepID=UPI00163FA4E2|nr:hypothetical protein [Burkholderia gladioli]
MTVYSKAQHILDQCAGTAAEEHQAGRVPGVDALIQAAATELAEHDGALPAMTRSVLLGFIVMVAMQKLDQAEQETMPSPGTIH